MTTPTRRTTARGERQKAGAGGPSVTREPDFETDALVELVAPLLHRLQAVQEEARRLGLFPNDRDLLACSNCGLAEDVLTDGRLVTSFEVGQPDTGLRFIEPASADGRFVCPACGAEAGPQQA